MGRAASASRDKSVCRAQSQSQGLRASAQPPGGGETPEIKERAKKRVEGAVAIPPPHQDLGHRKRR
ncbi:hypothetical protein C8Q73DRAFT_716676 [Cubamyces lactineus]|nr:hypothetical protein C8Q73DRAFT_716676 [Cubamyces lactineus]